MVSLNVLARPYAKAIFEIAKKKKNIKLWKKMLIFCMHVIKNKYLNILIKNQYSAKFLSKLLITICKFKINQNCINLIKITAMNKRLLIFPKILKQLIIMQNKEKKKKEITITLAYEINNIQKKKIKNFLNKKYKRFCAFRFFKNPLIIGGMIITINNTVYNFSIFEFLKKF
ncbi:F0F1 ATP synthase subunit delta [Buchnera aphidicola (Mollitrichosiphum nigrofasciatum)]|uniref:F0F1 ATP synthase subunit delta n=1 Tax=Buchnera aphidicola TaxID=9 RepID=UPI0031B82B56